MCAAIRQACAGDTGWEIVGEAGAGREALALIRRLRPDLIVLDLMLTDVSGFVVAERARAMRRSLRVLVLSEWLREYVVVRLEEIGVQGYLSKAESNPEALRAALHALAGGGTYFSARYGALKRERCADPLGAAKIISRAERRVLALIGGCHDDQAIAELLGISPATAQWHRSQLMAKLDLHTTPQLIAYAQANGFALSVGDITNELAHEAIAEHFGAATG